MRLRDCRGGRRGQRPADSLSALVADLRSTSQSAGATPTQPPVAAPVEGSAVAPDSKKPVSKFDDGNASGAVTVNAGRRRWFWRRAGAGKSATWTQFSTLEQQLIEAQYLQAVGPGGSGTAAVPGVPGPTGGALVIDFVALTGQDGGGVLIDLHGVSVTWQFLDEALWRDYELSVQDDIEEGYMAFLRDMVRQRKRLGWYRRDLAHPLAAAARSKWAAASTRRLDLSLGRLEVVFYGTLTSLVALQGAGMWERVLRRVAEALRPGRRAGIESLLTSSKHNAETQSGRDITLDFEGHSPFVAETGGGLVLSPVRAFEPPKYQERGRAEAAAEAAKPQVLPRDLQASEPALYAQITCVAGGARWRSDVHSPVTTPRSPAGRKQFRRSRADRPGRASPALSSREQSPRTHPAANRRRLLSSLATDEDTLIVMRDAAGRRLERRGMGGTVIPRHRTRGCGDRVRRTALPEVVSAWRAPTKRAKTPLVDAALPLARPLRTAAVHRPFTADASGDGRPPIARSSTPADPRRPLRTGQRGSPL